MDAFLKLGKKMASSVFLKVKNEPFVLDKSDYRFINQQKTLDSVGSELHRQGIGATKKGSLVIDEDLFREKALFGLSSPKVLHFSILA